MPTGTKAGEIVSNPERETLLDVLFSGNPYPVLVDRLVQTSWVRMQENPLVVKTQDINSIACEKLVAFAPCTTGVLYGADKEKRIIKQFFDVGNLFQLIDDMDVFKLSYHDSAMSEIKYDPERKISLGDEALKDTIS